MAGLTDRWEPVAIYQEAWGLLWLPLFAQFLLSWKVVEVTFSTMATSSFWLHKTSSEKMGGINDCAHIWVMKLAAHQQPDVYRLCFSWREPHRGLTPNLVAILMPCILTPRLHLLCFFKPICLKPKCYSLAENQLAGFSNNTQAFHPSETSGLITANEHDYRRPACRNRDYTGLQQSNQRTVMSKSISSPLSALVSGSAFDVMDKTGCNDLI